MGLRARLLQLCRLITCTCVYLTLWLLDAGAAGQRPYPLPTSPPNHRMVNQGLSGSNQFGICFRPLPFFACWTTTSSRLQAGCVNISDILRYITRAQHGSNQGRRKCFDLRFFVLQRRSLRPRSGYRSIWVVIFMSAPWLPIHTKLFTPAAPRPSIRVRTHMSDPGVGLWHPSPLRWGCGTPPGRPQPARGRLRALRGSSRRRSRVAEECRAHMVAGRGRSAAPWAAAAAGGTPHMPPTPPDALRLVAVCRIEQKDIFLPSGCP